jgi:hypothetical protein
MSLTESASQQPQRQPLTRAKRISPALKQALDLMVWGGKTDNDAAVEIGMTIQNIRFALKEPHVRSYYRGQLQVLRERESSRNIHALIEVRDQKNNQMARVQAVRAIEQLTDEQQAGTSKQSLPGLVVQINVTQQRIGNKTVIDNEVE